MNSSKPPRPPPPRDHPLAMIAALCFFPVIVVGAGGFLFCILYGEASTAWSALEVSVLGMIGYFGAWMFNHLIRR